MASQIFLDLKEHIAKNRKNNVGQYKEIKEALKTLGYKPKEIDKVLPGIYIANGTNQEIIAEALRRLKNVKVIG